MAAQETVERQKTRRGPGRAPFDLGGTRVQAGSRQTIDLPIADLSTHAPITMPVHVVHGRRAGPVLFVSAAVHGDEINGVEIIRRLMRLSALKRLRGTLIAVPIVNVPGFLSLSRYLPDRRDLNRAFPGSARGSLTARLAKLFYSEVVARCSHGIDLHTGAIHRDNYPQIRANLDDPLAQEMARAFGVPLVINAALRDGSLRAAAAQNGVPVIVYEAGEALRFSESCIRAGVKGVVRAMRTIGMLPSRRKPDPDKQSMLIRSTQWIRASRSGLLRATTALGDTVAEGQLLGLIADPFGGNEVEVLSPVEGFTIGRTNLPMVHEGDALFNIALHPKSWKATSHLDAFSPEDEYEQGATTELADEPQIV